MLRSCYRNSLILADANQVASIAFPNISTGIYRYPKQLAAKAAVEEVTSYLLTPDSKIKRVVFVCFDKENLEQYQHALFT
jgi:O-acetyl-ADP-ribose deacetylase